MAGSVHVVGAAGMGEALTALLADFQEDLGLSGVTFHKRSVTVHDRPRLKALLDKGAVLAAEPTARPLLEEMGLEVGTSPQAALDKAAVIIDCSAHANRNKDEIYSGLGSARGFVALGGDETFGTPLCHGVNNVGKSEERFIRIPTTMAHGMAHVVHALSGAARTLVEDARFVLLQRGSEVGVGADLPASPALLAHDDDTFGSSAARVAHEVLHAAGINAGVIASGVELNTQLLDALHFSVRVKGGISTDEAIARLQGHPRVAITDRLSANPIFSFARDHGWAGRMFNSLVLARPTLLARQGEVHGFALVPSDGTVLYSAVAAVLSLLEPDTVNRRLDALKPYVFREV